MKFRFLMFLGVISIVFSTVSLSFGGEDIWVSSKGAKLKADKKSSSSTVAKLKVGTKLSVIKFEKRWYNVKTPSGTKGWIYRGKISKEPPEIASEDDDSIGNMLGDLTASNIDVNEADSSRSIRGLSPEAKEYAKNNKTPIEYQNALDKILAYKISEKDIDAFLKSGRIGEFAE